MKVIFNDKSRICIGQGDDAGSFVWYCLNETYKDIWQREQVKLPSLSCISFEGLFEIMDNFLILSLENWFCDDEVTFRADDVICHRAKKI